MNVQPLEFEKPILELEAELEKMRQKSSSQDIDLGSEISAAEEKLEAMRKRIYQELTPWQRVQIARHTNRPFMLDYVKHVFEDSPAHRVETDIANQRRMPGQDVETLAHS